MVLVVDVNEKNIWAKLNDYPIDYTKEDLTDKGGDYTNTKRTFIVERKTIDDFIASVKKDRIIGQIRQMFDNYPDIPKYLIIEGEVDWRLMDIQDEQQSGHVYSVYVSLPSMFPSLGTYMTGNFYETLNLLTWIDKYSSGMKRRCESSLANSYSKIVPSGVDKRTISLINIPLLGLKGAKSLLEGDRSLEEIFNMSKEELTKIDNIGSNTANSINQFYTSKVDVYNYTEDYNMVRLKRIPGIGEKTAEKLLDKFNSYEGVMVADVPQLMNVNSRAAKNIIKFKEDR